MCACVLSENSTELLLLRTTHTSAHVSKLLYPSMGGFHCGAALNMLRMIYRTMLRITDLAYPGRKRLCTAIVLVAVCALTVSVATRYDSALSPDSRIASLQKDCSWEPGLQRLLNNAATWIPPVVGAAIFYSPAYYREVTPSQPTVASVLLERIHYNRPPPYFTSFSA